ncbi:MAG: acyl-CoA dehydrogenase family protein, partial [Betaproteobacteria bacterium]
MVLSEQHHLIRNALREFSQQQLLPHAAAWDRERQFP